MCSVAFRKFLYFSAEMFKCTLLLPTQEFSIHSENPLCNIPYHDFSVIGLFFPPGPFEFFKHNRTYSTVIFIKHFHLFRLRGTLMVYFLRTKNTDLLLYCRPSENFCCRFFLCDSIYYDCILASKGWLISPHTVTRFYTLLAL